jgi:hypothetical protein
MRLALALSLLLVATPAAAVSIRDYHASSLCAAGPVADGAVLVGDWCASHSLFVSALIGPFPSVEVPVLHFTATADGGVIADQVRVLPTDLGPFYDTLGVAFDVPLEADCCRGHAVQIVATLALIGGDNPSIALTVNDPVPEPATLILVTTTLAALGWRIRRRRCVAKSQQIVLGQDSAERWLAIEGAVARCRL